MLAVGLAAFCLAIGGNPVKIRVKESIVQPVSSHGCLQDYMSLPAAQYVAIPMPLSASLSRVVGTADLFHLCVPPVSFDVPALPVVEASPQVLARVSTEPDRVVIRSESCSISGSPIIEKLRLNERYEFHVQTCFTWLAAADEQEEIHSATEITVDVSPPGPFKYVPTWLLERVGNSVMKLALSSLQTTFVANLGADYARWATDEAYRLERERLGSATSEPE